MFDNILKEYLFSAKSIAILGAKDKAGQPVDRVGSYLLDRGFTVYPIHPVRKNVWGLETFKDVFELAQYLKEKSDFVEEKQSLVDIVCLFRAPEYCYAHAVETIESGLNPSLFWLQEGIKSKETAEFILSHKIKYVEDLCIKIEYERLLPHEFECALCGICCTGENGIIVDDTKDLPRLINYLKEHNLLSSSQLSEAILELDEKYTFIYNNKRVLRSKDKACLFFEEKKGCSIHKARPDICRAWPYFRGNILDSLSFEMAKKDCKGIIAKAKHLEFQKEAFSYLHTHSLFKDTDDKKAANALKYSVEERDKLQKIVENTVETV